MIDNLGDRMKSYYEDIWRIKLPRRMPLIIRLDGKSFHSLKLEKPFDEDFISDMICTTFRLCESIQGCQLAYVQSDEISLLLHDYKKLESQAWFGKNLQKIISISAAMASIHFDYYYNRDRTKSPNFFDARTFVLPESEVCNYFIWRQKDWLRNSIQMLAQSLYSHKELDGKNCADLHEMCFTKGHNWNNLPTRFKRGICINTHPTLSVDYDIPNFHENRNYIERYLKCDE